jgi:hypothetical protein
MFGPMLTDAFLAFLVFPTPERVSVPQEAVKRNTEAAGLQYEVNGHVEDLS